MTTFTSTCDWRGIAPLALQWTDNPISVQGSGATYGIAMTVSEPSQFFSPRPALNFNNTFFADINQCKTESNYSCIAYNGGVYKPPEGVNVTMDPTAWNGTPGADVVVGDSFQEKLYNDVLHIANHEIPGFPFYTYEQSYDAPTLPSALALGINSSFLQAALDLYIIGTKAWSLWPGNWYLGLDGLLILGGYDQDRVGSAFTTYDVGWRSASGTPIPMHLEVTGLDWEFSAGNSTNLFPNDTTTLDVSLEPYVDYVELPYDSFAIFSNYYNVSYNYTTGSYVFNDWPTGNLIITLKDGSKTTIPSDDLFDWPVGYDDRGYLEYTNYTYYTSKVSTGYGTGGSYLYFGQPFLSQKVIVADFEAGKYHIADAVKQDLGPGARNLQPLCTGGTPIPNGTVPTNSTIVHEPKKKTNVAAIAGGVGGGVGGLLIIAGIIFFLVRRKKKQNREDVPYLPEVIHASETPHRGSAVSPAPPKYMKSGVYETVKQDYNEPPRFSSPPPQTIRLTPGVSSMGTPRSDGARTSTWGGSTPGNRRSVAGLSSTDHNSQYEMSAGNRFAATSGPIEMPSEYEYDERIDGRRPEH